MQNLKQKVANLLDDENTSLSSRMVDWVIISTIIVTVISIVLESEPSLHPRFTPTFVVIEYLSLVIFGIEYILRVWSAPENPAFQHLPPRKARWSYLLSFHAIIDLLAILPPLLSFFSVDLRFLRVVRLLRVFKLTRYNSAMNTLVVVFKREANALLSVLFVIVIIMIIASSCIYLLEHEAQPETFGSILQSMWWSIVTLSTVGYGDISPVTPFGKLFGGLIMIAGIGLVALPAGILASAFSDQLHQNKSDYRSAIRKVLDDGVITADEYASLRVLQEKYDITEADAKAMIQEQLHNISKKRSEQEHSRQCPHCGKAFTD